MADSKRFLGNMGWLMGGRIVIMLLQFLISLATARFLGPTNFGIINYVAAYVSFFSSVASLGLAVIVIKEITQNPEASNKIIWTSIWLRLGVAVVSTISVMLLTFVGNPNDPLYIKIAFYQSLSILFSAFDTINYYFQATLTAKWGTIASVIAYICMSIYRIVLLMQDAQVEWFALATTIDMAILVLFLFYFYARIEGVHPCFDWKTGKRLLKQSYHYLIAGLVTILLEQIDRIMIGNMLDKTSVGIYSAMLTISTIWGMLPSALIQSITPILYETAKKDRALYLRRVRQSYAVLFWLNILYSLGINLFGKWVILLLYGESYSVGLGALRIVVWYYGISTLGMLSSVYLANERKNKYINVFAVVGLIMDAFLNRLLIPVLGICGAAIATLATHIIVQLGLPVLITDIRELGYEIGRGIILRDVLSESEKRKIKMKLVSLLGKIR